MSLKMSVLIAIATALFIIGVQQTIIYNSLEYSYVFFTFSAGTVLYIKYLKQKRKR